MSQPIQVNLEQQQDYRFAIRFSEEIPVLIGDEPPPLGNAAGPSPMHLLAAAVGNCLSNSLLFAMRKFRQQPEPIRTAVTATVGRNAENRLRVQKIEVRLTLGTTGESLAHLDRALGQFEEFCTVTQSVRQGIPVSVEVFDSAGRQLK